MLINTSVINITMFIINISVTLLHLWSGRSLARGRPDTGRECDTLELHFRFIQILFLYIKLVWFAFRNTSFVIVTTVSATSIAKKELDIYFAHLYPGPNRKYMRKNRQKMTMYSKRFSKLQK